jgi:hypothetical protein
MMPAPTSFIGEIAIMSSHSGTGAYKIENFFSSLNHRGLYVKVWTFIFTSPEIATPRLEAAPAIIIPLVPPSPFSPFSTPQ